jgi:mannose-6-phosphate isomerase-like protein (cupin superfamily)
LNRLGALVSADNFDNTNEVEIEAVEPVAYAEIDRCRTPALAFATPMQEIAMPPDGTETIAKGPEDLCAKVRSQVVDAKPSFFRLEAQLPKQGRTDTPVAASDKMWVVLKTYAADGENGLHAHPNEDHTFIVLQGQATFYGPHDETRSIGKNEGVLLPHGTFYWFKAASDEPLVMVRIGAAAFDDVDRRGRINPDGSEMRGDSVENKQVELIMSDRWFR